MPQKHCFTIRNNCGIKTQLNLNALLTETKETSEVDVLLQKISNVIKSGS